MDTDELAEYIVENIEEEKLKSTKGKKINLLTDSTNDRGLYMIENGPDIVDERAEEESEEQGETKSKREDDIEHLVGKGLLGKRITGLKNNGPHNGHVIGTVTKIHKSKANKGKVVIQLEDENGNSITDENGKIVILQYVKPSSIIKQRVQKRKNGGRGRRKKKQTRNRTKKSL